LSRGFGGGGGWWWWGWGFWRLCPGLVVNIIRIERGGGGGGHTKDRRYESNDSREMGKWSMSPLLLAKLGLLLSLEVRER
jgi:hypothetical protein